MGPRSQFQSNKAMTTATSAAIAATAAIDFLERPIEFARRWLSVGTALDMNSSPERRMQRYAAPFVSFAQRALGRAFHRRRGPPKGWGRGSVAPVCRHQSNEPRGGKASLILS